MNRVSKIAYYVAIVLSWGIVIIFLGMALKVALSDNTETMENVEDVDWSRHTTEPTFDDDGNRTDGIWGPKGEDGLQGEDGVMGPLATMGPLGPKANTDLDKDGKND